ncbi:MAG: hypothetical protein VB118_11640 [Oscillospiraceae bacterium]|nr:hypothetical protein [Oscillospiraceae bacterium]
MTIGEKIKSLRRKNDVTQEKLADYLRYRLLRDFLKYLSIYCLILM